MEVNSDLLIRFLNEVFQTAQLTQLNKKERKNYENSLDYAEEKKGFEMGLKMGLEKSKKEIAKNLLSEGLSIEMMAKTTNLSQEQIQKIKDNL